MGWADIHINKLQAGETVQFRPRGHSMTGIINSGQLVTVAPIANYLPLVGDEIDIVLCKVNGRQYLHKLKAIKGDRYLICNAKGYENGWTSLDKIYGIVIQIEA